MSSCAYSTRSKAKVGFAANSGESQFQSQTQSTPNAEETPAQELGTPFSPTQRSYRDALVSRSPSPDQGIGYTIRNDPDMFPNTLPIERDNENYLPCTVSQNRTDDFHFARALLARASDGRYGQTPACAESAASY